MIHVSADCRTIITLNIYQQPPRITICFYYNYRASQFAFSTNAPLTDIIFPFTQPHSILSHIYHAEPSMATGSLSMIRFFASKFLKYLSTYLNPQWFYFPLNIFIQRTVNAVALVCPALYHIWTPEQLISVRPSVYCLKKKPSNWWTFYTTCYTRCGRW